MGVDPDPTRMDMDGRYLTHMDMDNPLGARDVHMIYNLKELISLSNLT
jgi:hypothetical protein